MIRALWRLGGRKLAFHAWLCCHYCGRPHDTWSWSTWRQYECCCDCIQVSCATDTMRYEPEAGVYMRRRGAAWWFVGPLEIRLPWFKAVVRGGTSDMLAGRHWTCIIALWARRGAAARRVDIGHGLRWNWYRRSLVAAGWAMGEAADGSVASVKSAAPRHIWAPGCRGPSAKWRHLGEPSDERGTADQGIPGDRHRLGSFDADWDSRAAASCKNNDVSRDRGAC